MTVGHLRQLIKDMPDEAAVTICYWTLTDLYGDQTLRALTFSNTRSGEVVDHGVFGKDLVLRTMTQEEIDE